MGMSEDERQRIEVYLGRLRRGLRGMDKEDAREIVDELRSHLIDKASTGVTAALAGLGSPEDLASQYVTDELLARAEVSRSPFRILNSLFRWASLSVAGFFVLLGSITGYFLGAAFLLSALLKPFFPQTAGLWIIPEGAGDSSISLHLGVTGTPVIGRELLGWWIIPVGLAVGCTAIIVTTRFALWCVRRYRRSRVPAHA
jgi:uncharacterized membrane protein